MNPITPASLQNPPPQSATPEDVLIWATEFQPHIALSCSFGGPGGMVLAHMLSRCAPSIPLLFIDTEFLFPETYALRDAFVARYGLQVLTYKPRTTPGEQAARYGEHLWEHDPDACCHMRKVEPMARALDNLNAWITSLRRDQSVTRSGVEVVEEHTTATGHRIFKINPLAHWNRQQVWNYLHEHQVPYNSLLDTGYKSIGCMQCTARVDANAEERAGRWVGQGKTECGLHTFTRQTHSD